MRIVALAFLAAAFLARSSPSSAQLSPGDPDPRETISRTEEMPIEGRVDPETYRVGPGDEFAFRYSDLMDPKILRVNPAGDLLLPDAGAVPVAGLTLREAEAKIREVLRGYVRGKGLVFTLFRPRRFRIPILGEVASPGAVTLGAPARASEAIAAAGGLLPSAASRGIEVRRGGDTLFVDLVRYARTGDLNANPLVFETDVVFVPATGRRVSIYGAVVHAGDYDFIPGDRASGLVALAGGVRPEAALDEAEIERPSRQGESADRIKASLTSALAGPGGSEDPALQDGDRLLIPARAHYREGALVWIEGEVAHPGPYAIRDGAEGVRALIERAGGLTEFADIARARIDRGRDEAERDSSYLRLARDHEDFLTNAEREYVKIRLGQRSALAADLAPLLEHATATDLMLMNGDYIVVPRRALTVSVQGEVRSPGHVLFEPGLKASDYIRASGGFTGRADPARVRVTVGRTEHQLSVSEAGALHAGDTVWVLAKREQSGWAAVREAVLVAAQLATIYLVIQQARR